MKTASLCLYTDRLAPKAEWRLQACSRVVYVREGDALLRGGGHAAGLGANSAWQGRDQLAVNAGAAGATLLRWELAAEAGASADAPAGSVPAGVSSTLTLAHSVELGDPGGYLMRCDRVDFPLGGIAYTHVHRGPGIRCLLMGGFRVEVNGKGQDISPGGAWFEAGPDPVLAMASTTELSGFARVMILPRELKGKSSIRYVKPEDADKPKLQTYRIFADEYIEL